MKNDDLKNEIIVDTLTLGNKQRRPIEDMADIVTHQIRCKIQEQLLFLEKQQQESSSSPNTPILADVLFSYTIANDAIFFKSWIRQHPIWEEDESVDCPICLSKGYRVFITFKDGSGNTEFHTCKECKGTGRSKLDFPLSLRAATITLENLSEAIFHQEEEEEEKSYKSPKPVISLLIEYPFGDQIVKTIYLLSQIFQFPFSWSENKDNFFDVCFHVIVYGCTIVIHQEHVESTEIEKISNILSAKEILQIKCENKSVKRFTKRGTKTNIVTNHYILFISAL